MGHIYLKEDPSSARKKKPVAADEAGSPEPGGILRTNSEATRSKP
jgi:hypothetical protein